MSACYRTNTGTRSHWRPCVFPTGARKKNSLVEHFGYSSKLDVAGLVDDGNVIVHEEFVDSNQYALWKIASPPVSLPHQVSSLSSMGVRKVPCLAQYLFEEGWGNRHYGEYVPEDSLQKLRFELDIDEELLQNEAHRHISAGFWIGVISQMSEFLLRPYSPNFKPRWVICSLSSPTRTSYHIILSNYSFSNSHVCMALTRLIKRAVTNELFQKMLNEDVCQPNYCFRILNCSKWGTGQIKRLILKESFPDFEYEFPQEIYRNGEAIKPILHFMDELAATLITYTVGFDHNDYPA